MAELDMKQVVVNNQEELKAFFLEELLSFFEDEVWQWAEMLGVKELLALDEDDNYLVEKFPELDELRKMDLSFENIDLEKESFPVLINYCFQNVSGRYGTDEFKLLNFIPLNTIRGFNKPFVPHPYNKEEERQKEYERFKDIYCEEG